jgi:hypothetical protein
MGLAPWLRQPIGCVPSVGNLDDYVLLKDLYQLVPFL